MLCSAHDPSPKQQPGYLLNVLCSSSWVLISWSIPLQCSLVFMPFFHIAKVTLSLELVLQPNFVSSVCGWDHQHNLWEELQEKDLWKSPADTSHFAIEIQ